LPTALVGGNLGASRFAVPDCGYQRTGDAAPMTLDPNTTDPAEQPSRWLGIVKFLLLVVLVGSFYLLGQAMVRHRFFRGGYVDQRDVLRP
jgi:hypothetical protein